MNKLSLILKDAKLKGKSCLWGYTKEFFHSVSNDYQLIFDNNDTEYPVQIQYIHWVPPTFGEYNDR
jgi:hypothetical protein